MLTYEHQLMRAEAETLAALARAGVEGVPAVLAADFAHGVVGRDTLFMSFIEGELLSVVGKSLDEADRVRIRRDVGRISGAASRILGPTFGYPAQPKLQASNWPAAFARMIGRLIDDARRYQAPIASRLEDIAAAFGAASAILADDAPAQMVHFDLWDGNVLVRRDADGWRLSGVIDWERVFYGDPAADLVNLTMTRSPAERAAVLEGLAEGRGETRLAGAHDERRLALYRAYLWLIMIVEAGPRGFGGSIRLPGSSAERRLDRDLAIAAGA